MGLDPRWLKTVNVALAIVALYVSTLVDNAIVAHALMVLAGFLPGGALVQRPGDVALKDVS